MFLAAEEEKYATAEASELEKVQTAAMKAEKEASDMKTKAEADAKKLLDDANRWKGRRYRKCRSC